MFGGFFSEFLTLSILGGHNFFNFNMFLTIFSGSSFVWTPNNGALRLDPTCPERSTLAKEKSNSPKWEEKQAKPIAAAPCKKKNNRNQWTKFV